MPKKNREERRHEKFGHGRANDRGGWPTSRPNPAFGDAESPATDEAVAGSPDQGQTDDTGPGSGGATQEPGRQPHHEGAKPGNSTKG
jgi:hypothetical protein